MSTTLIQIRTDEEVKKQAKAIFEDLGLDLSTAINIFLKNALEKKVFHFLSKKQNSIRIA